MRSTSRPSQSSPPSSACRPRARAPSAPRTPTSASSALAGLVPFVQLDLPGAGGLPDGRYIVRDGADGTETVLVSELIGALPARGRLRGRKPATEQPGAAPAELPIRRLTFALAERYDDAAAAERWLAQATGDAAEELVEAAIAPINRAIAAFRVSAGDPLVSEITSEHALAIRLGFGTGDEVAASGWSRARRLPPSRRRQSRPGTEDIRPPQRMAAILAGRDSIDAWELHALRARLDLKSGRSAEAAGELRAAIAAFDASPPDFAPNLRDEIAGRLAAARASFGAAEGSLAGPPAEPDPEALADAAELFERLQHRRRRPPID